MIAWGEALGDPIKNDLALTRRFVLVVVVFLESGHAE
jgi:hypothetical protein